MSAPSPTIVEPLRRVLGWLLGLRNSEGAILCPAHGIEHTGKSAGVIVIAAGLARHDPQADRAALRDIAVQQGERLVARLEREGDSTCFTFRPGRHDPYNCSNNVIDGGACADALAELSLTFGEELSAEQRERFQHACVLHAQTYLRYAILDKAIPAQRAWAMTGAAGAWRLAGHEVLELAVMEGVGILEGLQYPDGSYAYHPLEGHPGHPGASDVSAFYQSRVTAFLLFSLERMGRDPRSELFRGPILRGLEFLEALHGPDGIKVGAMEAKPWYWGADREVASHPFDVFALARGWSLFGREDLGRAALGAFQAWAERLDAQGAPRSHLPEEGWGSSYQCPVFWAGHASWIARSLVELGRLEQLEAPARGEGAGLELSQRHHPDAGLVRLEDDAVVAWVRGARPPFNVHHGSPRGAGLVRVHSKQSGAELLRGGPSLARLEGEWSASAGLPSLSRGIASGGKDVRFSLWLARNAWRTGRRASALTLPARTALRGVLLPSLPVASSAWFLQPEVRLHGDGAELLSGLAHANGEPVPGARLRRAYRLTGGGLEVEEELLEYGAARRPRFRPPAMAEEVVRRSRSHWSYLLR